MNRRTWGKEKRGKHYKGRLHRATRQMIRLQLHGHRASDRRLARASSEVNWKGE